MKQHTRLMLSQAMTLFNLIMVVIALIAHAWFSTAVFAIGVVAGAYSWKVAR